MDANFLERLKAGAEVDCPTCGRYSKMYHRRIHSGMARQLITLYSMGGADVMHGGTGEIHTSEIMKRCGHADFPLAKHWDLVRSTVNIAEPDKKDSGRWSLTARGVAYVIGSARIEKYAYIFDDRCVGFSAELVSIRDTLGKKFNYQELFDAPVIT